MSKTNRKDGRSDDTSKGDKGTISGKDEEVKTTDTTAEQHQKR